MSTSLRLLIALAPAIFVLLWSTGFIGSKMGAPYAGPFTFLSLRYVVAGILLILLALATAAPRLNRRQIGHSFVVGMLIHGVYLGAVFWAISRGMPAGIAALITALQPLITALAVGPALGQPLSRRQWTGIGIGFLGVVLVLAPKIDLTGAGLDPANVAACFLAAVGISLGTLYQKRFVGTVDLRSGGIFQYMGALAVTLPFLVLFEDGRIVWSGEFLFALGWLVLVLSIGAISLLMLLIRHGDVSKVASLFYLVPVATAVESWLLFGETLGPLQIAGMGVAGFGVFLAARQTG